MTETKPKPSIPDLFYEKLVETLTAENKSLLLLKENLENQYSVLLEQKLSDFLKVLEEQKILVWEAKQKEKLRRQELQSFLQNKEKISLKETIKNAPSNYKQDIENLKSEFDQYIETIEMMKSRNQILIQKSLEMIQDQISYLRSFERKGYNASGKHEGNDSSFISRQV